MVSLKPSKKNLPALDERGQGHLLAPALPLQLDRDRRR